MKPPTESEKWDIGNILIDNNFYPSLHEHRKTENVSYVAVLADWKNLEYVPETVINREICCAALDAQNADCSILSYIPYPDVQKEAIQRFSADTPAFVLYSYINIKDAEMAQDAVKADAYCIQLVPDELLTEKLCRTALQNPNADEKMLLFVAERFPELKTEVVDEKKENINMGVKMKL